MLASNQIRRTPLFLSAIYSVFFCLPAQAEPVEMEWIDLLPPEALLAYENMDPQVIDHSGNNFSMSWVPAAHEIAVVDDFDGADIRIAGYIVPLEFDDEFIVTEFFLVPYYGACIHVPPPPPNQIIHVVYEEGVLVEALYFPFWIEGELSTEMTVNDVAQSAYSLSASNVELYEF